MDPDGGEVMDFGRGLRCSFKPVRSVGCNLNTWPLREAVRPHEFHLKLDLGIIFNKKNIEKKTTYHLVI
jgi:hypothetical protein